MPRTHIPDPVHRWARQQPAAAALVLPGAVWTYAGLDRRAEASAARLRAHGLVPGGRLALYAENSAELIALLLAVWRVGGIACPVSTRVPWSGVGRLLETVGAPVLATEHPGDLGPGIRILRVADLTGEEGGASEAPPWRLAAPATAVFTSGSTGEPKAALHSLGNHVFSAEGSNANIRLAPGDRWLLALPLYHVGGLAILFRCWLAGAAVVVPARGEALGTAMARHGVTHASLVATQLGRLLREEAPALGALKAVLLGGSAIPEALLRTAHARGLPIHTTYGLTEMASQVTTTPPGAALPVLRTSGRVLPHRALRIAGSGEILVGGATRFLGYLRAGERETPFDEDGWFATRDLGRLDADGYLHVEGRTDNQFVSGGENIQPERIERVLRGVEGVRRAVVVPVKDAEFGQRPVAFVEGGPAPAALRAALEPALPRFMIPVAFHPWPDRAEGMKVDRSALREHAERLQQGKS
ncbi:MAG: o-succinylbenzoate--CoA ligase [Rhodothermales bacterium]|nr:o-succinylbenzoate--CoA ligase [Rhodothermales bacterium]